MSATRGCGVGVGLGLGEGLAATTGERTGVGSVGLLPQALCSARTIKPPAAFNRHERRLLPGSAISASPSKLSNARDRNTILRLLHRQNVQSFVERECLKSLRQNDFR
jgi:hypothetical protein